MTKKLQIWLWSFLFFGLTGCVFENDEFFGDFTTDLRITVRDAGLRERITNATVVLYRSQTDFEARKSAVAVAKTNENGVVWFQGLQDVNYYIYASHERNGRLHDNSTADFNMGQELVSGALTEVDLVVRPARPLNPTDVTVESVWLMDYETDLDSTKRLSMEFFLWDSLIDDYYEVGNMRGFYRYKRSSPVNEEDNSKELNPDEFYFNLENAPILYVLTGEITRKSRNEFDTVYISWDSVSFATHKNQNFYPDRIRVAEWDDITLDLKVSWE